MFLVVGQQVCTHLRRDFVPLLFAGPDGTWLCPSFLWCSAVVLSPWQKNTPKAQCFHLHVWRWGWCSWGHRQHSSSSKHLSWVDAKELDFDLTDHNTCTQFTSESLANLRRAWTCAFLSMGTFGCAAGFQSFTVYCVTNCFLGDYGPSCLEIIDKILPCSSGLIPHCSYDH